MKIKRPGNHLDQLLRQTRDHHVRLSAMADVKANILLTVSSVVLTLSIRYVTDPTLKWGASVLILFCLLTGGRAIYTVMPKIPFSIKPGPHPDVHSPTFNLLFFGDFARLSYPEFESAMEEVLNNDDRTYEAQVREVYTLGRFLATKKYRYVRLAYLSFISGLCTSGLVLIISGLLV